MVDVEWTTAQPGGVTLVGVRIDNRVAAPGVDAHRVELVPQLDGPVWPPRVEGVPAGPWDCDGGHAERARGADEHRADEHRAGEREPSVAVVVPTGRVGSVGFASPAEPVEPPVEVASVEPAHEREDADPDPEDVLRVLGDPSPPRDAVWDEERATSTDGTPATEDRETPADGRASPGSVDRDQPAPGDRA